MSAREIIYRALAVPRIFAHRFPSHSTGALWLSSNRQLRWLHLYSFQFSLHVFLYLETVLIHDTAASLPALVCIYIRLVRR